MGHTFVVTHTDLDGVASAAVYLRIAGLEPDEATVVFAEPYNLHEAVGGYAEYMEKGDVLAVMDLGVNRSVLDSLVSTVQDLLGRGVEVEWYDHHVWGPEAERFKSMGVKLFVDRSTCATGVVAKYAPTVKGVEADGYIRELVAAVCAADLWRWDHHLAPKLFRILGRRGEDEWRSRLLEKLYSGTLWDEEMQQKLEDYVNRELKGFSKILSTAKVKVGRSGCRVVVARKDEGPPSNSIVGSTLLYRFQADIAVIARPNGAISLRSRRVNVERIASMLGGGGHPRAAGARLRLPLHVRLLRILWPPLESSYVASAVLRAAEAAGVC
ncbi:DHH family phosphoesterase [Stetteria hydrogenophila]